MFSLESWGAFLLKILIARFTVNFISSLKGCEQPDIDRTKRSHREIARVDHVATKVNGENMKSMLFVGVILSMNLAQASYWQGRELINQCYVRIDRCHQTKIEDKNGNVEFSYSWLEQDTFEIVPKHWPASKTYLETEYAEDQKTIVINRKDLKEGQSLEDAGLEACELEIENRVLNGGYCERSQR